MTAAYDGDKLARAIEFDHPNCDDNTCDLSKAAAIGCYLWAAHLLTGATECEETEKAFNEVYNRLGKAAFDVELELERQQLLAEPHWECSECGSLIWTSEGEAFCANCGKLVYRPEEDEDADV